MFAEDIVSYAGQSIFAIAATDMASARAALAHARISYEPLPAILTIDEAMAAFDASARGLLKAAAKSSSGTTMATRSCSSSVPKVVITWLSARSVC